MDINTTPLIDVMLVLLVMLIITIPIQLHAVNLEMPVGVPPDSLVKPEKVQIDIDEKSVVYWQGLPVTAQELDEKMSLVAQQPVPARDSPASQQGLPVRGVCQRAVHLQAQGPDQDRRHRQRAVRPMSATTMHRRRYRGTDPTRRMVGWSVVIAVHLLVLWARDQRTARRGLELIKKPLEAVGDPGSHHSAATATAAAPPKEIPKPPEQKVVKAAAPPPTYVPPPEVQPPVSSSDDRGAVAADAAGRAARDRATAALGGRQHLPVRAPTWASPVPTQVRPEMPRKAIRDGTEGVVKAQALIRDGLVREVTILSGPRVFHAAVQEAMKQYKCVSGSGDAIATQEFVFKID